MTSKRLKNNKKKRIVRPTYYPFLLFLRRKKVAFHVRRQKKFAAFFEMPCYLFELPHYQKGKIQSRILLT